MERFNYQITVGSDVIDMFGHVSNIEYVRWVQDAAVNHSVHAGYGWEAYKTLGAAFVIRRHAIEYLRPAHEGEVLTISTWMENMTRVTALRGTEITNERGEVILVAQTMWAFVATATMRPQRIPEEVKARFGLAGIAPPPLSRSARFVTPPT